MTAPSDGFQRFRKRSPIPLVCLWAVWVRVDEIKSIDLVQGTDFRAQVVWPRAKISNFKSSFHDLDALECGLKGKGVLLNNRFVGCMVL